MDNDISSFDLMQVLEKESKNAIVVKKMYVLMCERDYASAILLSQIMYWFGENKDGIKRAKMTHNGRACVIKQAYEWMEECELSFKQYNRALAYLKRRGFITTEIHKSELLYKNETATFMFLEEENLWKSVKEYLEKQEKPHSDGESLGYPGRDNPGYPGRDNPTYNTENTKTETTLSLERSPIGDSKKEKKKKESIIHKPFSENDYSKHISDSFHKTLVDEHGIDKVKKFYQCLEKWWKSKLDVNPKHKFSHTAEYYIQDWVIDKVLGKTFSSKKELPPSKMRCENDRANEVDLEAWKNRGFDDWEDKK